MIKKRLITTKKAAKARLIREIQRGRAPFRGAQTPTGGKDPKNLRGVKGLLRKTADEADAQHEP